MIKKIVCCMICIFLFSGCFDTGSFEKGNIKEEEVIYRLNEHILKEEWNMDFLNENVWEQQRIENNYGINIHQFENVYIFSSVLASQMEEVAFFHVDTSNVNIAKQAVSQRKKALLEEAKTQKMDEKILEKTMWEGKIGEYYCFLVGTDTEKVVHYLYSLT